MKRLAYFLMVLPLTLLAALAIAVPWNATWELVPDGTVALASDIDQFIKDFKVEVRKRASVENIYGNGTDDNGLMRPGSARAFSQNTTPGSIDGPGQYNSAAGGFAGALLTTDEIGAAVRDLGAGRFWIDVDGPATGVVAAEPSAADAPQLSVWDETLNNFRRVVARDQGGAGIGASNLIYNGSFEVTDGTGATGSLVCPLAATGGGWANSAPAPTCTYADPAGVSEGEGIALNVTGTGANGGLTQTLAALKANTTYLIRARVNPVGAGDLCNLVITGGVVSPVTDISAAGTGVYETLESLITTTGVPADIVVKLETQAAADICRWDHVIAFERYATVAQPGIQVCRTTDSSTGANYYGTGAWSSVTASCAITPPGPGYWIRVSGFGQGDDDNGANDASFMLRLQRNGTTVVTAAMGYRILTTPGVPIAFSQINPAPGTTLTFSLEGRINAAAGNLDRNIDDAGELAGETPVSWLQVELIPTR